MDEAKDTEQLLRWLQGSGFEFGSCCVVPEGVFFRSKQFAATFARIHDKDVVPINGPVSGWLAKNRDTPTDS
jgi:hypothetical protein